MDAQEEIQKQFRQQQEKYVYYIIALCVTSIGFAVLKTNGQPMKLIQIPLGIAVLSWGVSIYCGLTFLQYLISNLFANNLYYDVIKGNHKKVGNNAKMIEDAATGINEAMNDNSRVASIYAKWQNISFYSGVILFIVWHILEMFITPIVQSKPQTILP